MEIWQAIKEDHRSVEAIIEQLQEDRGNREQLVHRLKHELEAHTEAEEKAVYPELRKIAGFEQLIEHSLEEHREIRLMLHKLGSVAGEEWSKLLEQLRSTVHEHVEEEEKKVIPMAQKETPGKKSEKMMHEFELAKEAISER